jgi:hypothetical protein
MRRLQKVARSRPVPGACWSRWEVIRKPEITKNTSTPTKPPLRACGARW